MTDKNQPDKSEKIRVLIVDYNVETREKTRSLLAQEKDLEVQGVARTGREARGTDVIEEHERTHGTQVRGRQHATHGEPAEVADPPVDDPMDGARHCALPGSTPVASPSTDLPCSNTTSTGIER